MPDILKSAVIHEEEAKLNWNEVWKQLIHFFEGGEKRKFFFGKKKTNSACLTQTRCGLHFTYPILTRIFASKLEACAIFTKPLADTFWDLSEFISKAKENWQKSSSRLYFKTSSFLDFDFIEEARKWENRCMPNEPQSAEHGYKWMYIEIDENLQPFETAAVHYNRL